MSLIELQVFFGRIWRNYCVIVNLKPKNGPQHQEFCIGSITLPISARLLSGVGSISIQVRMHMYTSIMTVYTAGICN